MQIDLLLSTKGEVGILSDTDFETEPSGVIFDGIERTLTLEFSETYDSMVLNVPVADDIARCIIQSDDIQMGILVKGRVAKALQLPLMHVNVDEDEYYEAAG